MISRKKKLIKRKARFSNLLLTDKEHHLVFFLEKQTWLSEPIITITKKKLIEIDLFWNETLKALEHKGRLKNIQIYRTKISVEVIPEQLTKTCTRDLPDPELFKNKKGA